jgi:small ligand-binding sensory domain FIST
MPFSRYAAVGHWRQPDFEDAALQDWAEEVRARLQAPDVTLGLVFLSPSWFQHAARLLELLRVHAQIPLLAGCSSTGLIAGAEEAEDDPGFVLALYHLPGAQIVGHRFEQAQVAEGDEASYWPLEMGISPAKCRGWLVFADPFQMDCERWLNQWNQSYGKVATLGGLASGDQQNSQIYLNGEVFESGGVALSFSGEVALESIIAQGCTPFGETWTITKAEGNLIQQIANRPAYEVLVDSFNTLSEEVQKKSRGNLFIGLVVNEYLEDFQRGDFLIRNLLGADPSSGILAVGTHVRPGQTLQFQRRDAAAASEDMEQMLGAAKKRLGGREIFGGCLCCCNGRGQRLFGQPSHDASMLQHSLGPLGLTGFFCNGELGPVGERNFLHGYTASATLFVGNKAS